jgi:lipid-binding SYLF domain-containing protein
MRIVTRVFAAASIVLVAACESQPKTEAELQQKQQAEQQALARDLEKRQREADELTKSAQVVVERAKRDFAATAPYFDRGPGYVVFPKVAKGGLVVGGSHGKGVVFEKRSLRPDRAVGTASITQGSIGLQIGGQTFSEIIFFEDEAALAKFKKGDLEVSATASGVFAAEGGTAAARYENGVALCVFGEKGLMGEASVGGQKFSFEPLP